MEDKSSYTPEEVNLVAVSLLLIKSYERMYTSKIKSNPEDIKFMREFLGVINVYRANVPPSLREHLFCDEAVNELEQKCNSFLETG